MNTFKDEELKLIRELSRLTPQSVLQSKKACPTHSVCNPLPLFRVYKIDENSFEAQWNGYHDPGTKQTFRFDEVLNS